MDHVTRPCSCQGQFVVRRLGRAMINMHTKFEVFTFTDYKNMKGNAKCRNWGRLGVRSHPRSPAMSPIDRAHAISCMTNRNYAPTLWHSRVIASYLSKVAYFNLPHLHSAPCGDPFRILARFYGYLFLIQYHHMTGRCRDIHMRTAYPALA